MPLCLWTGSHWTKIQNVLVIERAERRHRRKAIAAVAVIALLVLVGAAVLLGLTRGCTVKAPAYKNYGTEQFDTQAQAYLKSAAAENEKIIGYLAFPGQNGQLVYVRRSWRKNITPSCSASCRCTFICARTWITGPRR